MPEQENNTSHDLQKIDAAEILEDHPELKNLPPKQQKAVVQYIMRLSASYSCQLPPPAALAEYDKLYPGLGSTLGHSIVEEGNHRRQKENKILSIISLGQIFAFILCILFIGAGCYALYCKEPWVAGGIFGTGIIGVASCFMQFNNTATKSAPPAPPPMAHKRKKKKKSK